MIIGLKKENEALKAELATNKLFTYMIIHDLKHPTEALKETIKTHTRKLERVVHIVDTVENGLQEK